MTNATDEHIIFVWENIGPGHADRLSATATLLADRYQVRVIELFEKSQIYSWDSASSDEFRKITVFKSAEDIGRHNELKRAFALIRACTEVPARNIFLCHYEYPSTLLTAWTLKLLGKRVFVMNDSKFDDYPRSLWRELIKAIFYTPYRGAVASGQRSADYLRFLGIPKQRIAKNYNSLSVNRLQTQTKHLSKEIDFNSRHFIIIARLVAKKNLFVSLDAYSRYCKSTKSPRRLKVLGDGELDEPLKLHAKALGIYTNIDWLGFVQTETVTEHLNSAVALLLLSTEEQFGNVVIEAIALGIPSIVTPQVGASDELIRSWINGFIVEHDNPKGIAAFMSLISSDEALWNSLSKGTKTFAHLCDSSQFAAAVSSLISE